MTVVAIWCRHEGDNIIGIGADLPWLVESDKKRFWDVVCGQTMVCGRKTYESFPQQLTEGRKIFVMTRNSDYEVSDKDNHFVIGAQKPLADLEEDIYVAGGAEIYSLFMSGKESLKPHIVVDCVYQGALDERVGEVIDITDSVNLLEKKYRRISAYYCLDNVRCAVWVRKGEFVEQSVLKRIVSILECGAELKWQL